ncbi:MAG: hypothetical protein IPK06_14705 [Ignavibacteriae bacterium]|nr:hypothetical protein [Ignavibacteriota bacterium]
MKNRSKIILLIALTFSIFTSNLFAQQWSSEQKEVWAGIENIGSFFKRRCTRIVSYFDESYIGGAIKLLFPKINLIPQNG